MKTLVLGNWKSNGSADLIREFEQQMGDKPTASGFEWGLALPHHLLASGSGLAPLWVGAQNVSAFPPGAYTGEITAGMLAESGCRFCLVGHSERRQYLGESVSDTAAKLLNLSVSGVLPVLCIGETLQERNQGKLEQVLHSQLEPLRKVADGTPMVVAYEPVWAIGTGVAASMDDVRKAHELIYRWLAEAGLGNLPILYGGSVKPANAESLAAVPRVDGFLVGGASLKPTDFRGIVDGFVRGRFTG